MSTPSLFDPDESARRRDEALKRVAANADPEWKRNVLVIIHELAMIREEFTTDAVWFMLVNRRVAEQHEKRAMGPAMKDAASKRWIERTDRYKQSVRVQCHRRPLKIWRSLIYLGGGINDGDRNRC